jgi:menaquinol-cytochrome c reductase iron-sulfur subunit
MVNPTTHRRGFLNFCTKFLTAAIALLLAVPAVAYLVGPLLGRRDGEGEGGFSDAGRLADLPIGAWRLLTVETVRQDGWKKARVRHAIWVRRTGPGKDDILVLSSICPHLGCPVNAHPDQGRFVCPCHGGIFDNNGRHVSGPPPRSMDPLAFEVRAGRLWVRWQDFKIGVGERIAVST